MLDATYDEDYSMRSSTASLVSPSPLHGHPIMGDKETLETLFDMEDAGMDGKPRADDTWIDATPEYTAQHADLGEPETSWTASLTTSPQLMAFSPPEYTFEDELHQYHYNDYSHESGVLSLQSMMAPSSADSRFHYDSMQSYDPQASYYGSPVGHVSASPSGRCLWDREAYHYDLQGNLIYKPPDRLDGGLVDDLSHLQLQSTLGSQSSSIRDPVPVEDVPSPTSLVTSSTTLPSWTTRHVGAWTWTNRNALPASSGRQRKCKFFPNCRAGPNCIYAHE